MINEDLKAEIARAEQQSGKQQAVMGSLCFFCAGSKTAVFQDDDLKDGLGQVTSRHRRHHHRLPLHFTTATSPPLPSPAGVRGG